MGFDSGVMRSEPRLQRSGCCSVSAATSRHPSSPREEGEGGKEAKADAGNPALSPLEVQGGPATGLLGVVVSPLCDLLYPGPGWAPVIIVE